MANFGENVQKTLFLTNHPQIKVFFQNSRRVTFLFYWVPTSCYVSEKLMSGLQDIWGLADHRQRDKVIIIIKNPLR